MVTEHFKAIQLPVFLNGWQILSCRPGWGTALLQLEKSGTAD
jgi:hypothetical protein